LIIAAAGLTSNTDSSLDVYQRLIWSNSVDAEPCYMAAHPRSAAPTHIKQGNYDILINWLIRVSYELEFHESTLFLAVTLFGRVAPLYPIGKTSLQLFGATSLWMGAKLEECVTPTLSDFAYLCGGAYTPREFIDCEAVILSLTGFSVSSTTTPVYLDWTISASGPDSVDSLARLISLSALFSQSLSSIRPSVVALAAYLIACNVARTPGRKMEMLVGIGNAEIVETVSVIQDAMARVMDNEENQLGAKVQTWMEAEGMDTEEFRERIAAEIGDSLIEAFR
jgi:hypothetical protein